MEAAFINQTVTARAKLEEFFQMEDATADRQEPQDVSDLTDVKGDIVFDNVTFEFPNSGQGVYDVSFEIKPGQTVAIVGPSVSTSSALVASSRTRMGESFKIARAIARRWRSPPESCEPRSPTTVS